MSAIDDLSTRISAYPEAIRLARVNAKLSNNQLAERSGVPYSTVCKVQCNLQHITLPQAAALCLTLGVTLDSIMPIPVKGTPFGELHAMELKMSDQAGDMRVLQTVNDMQAKHIRTLRRERHIALVLCALLTIGLTAYVVVDYRIPNAGLIQVTGLSAGGWLMLTLLIAAAAILSWLLLRMSINHTKDHVSKSDTERGNYD